MNIVLDTIEEVENLIDGTNIEIDRDQDIRDILIFLESKISNFSMS